MTTTYDLYEKLPGGLPEFRASYDSLDAASAAAHDLHWAASIRVSRPRSLDLVPRKRWTLIAEDIGGDRTARWFVDNDTGLMYGAESWKRPNLHHMLNSEQAAYVVSLLPHDDANLPADTTRGRMAMLCGSTYGRAEFLRACGV